MISKYPFFLLLVLIMCQGYGQNNYYFSSSIGNDSNTGSQTDPFQTISKLNSLTLEPGDTIYFKRGDIFEGQITINYSGAESLPIVYDSYGTGALPILSGSNGNNGIADPVSTINIVGKQYLEFHNLQIENERFDSTGADDDKSFGIYFISYKSLPGSGNFEDVALFKHFRFTNLVFQNIYSLDSSGTPFNEIRSSGIHFFNAFVNDMVIENCHFTNIERVGIWLRKYVSDAIIKNNDFVDLGGSGTIISNSKRVLYEKNLMRFSGSDRDSRMTGRGSGMWVFGSDDVVAQYNISQHARGAGDSSGMHVDYGNTNILFQYNYSEDSAGGFCETLGNNNNVIWRYNVSINDGTTDRGGKNRLLWVSDYAFTPKKSENVYIYNNTIYQGTDYVNEMSDSEILLKASSLYFINNIIYLEPTARLGETAYLFDVDTPNFAKNLFWGGTIKTEFKNLDATRVEVDPRFIATGRRHFSGYQILYFGYAVLGDALSFTEPVFPLAGVGIFSEITSNVTEDIYGNPVNLSSSANIGAYNGSGESNYPEVTTIEAESGTIEGGGTEIDCVNASGGKAVNVISSGKSVYLENINITMGGLYMVNVHYANPIRSSFKLTVNNGETESYLLPESDAYCYQSGNPTAFPVICNLNTGSNTLKLEGTVIDKIEIFSVNESTLDIMDIPFLNGNDVRLERMVLTCEDTLKLISENQNENKVEVSIYDLTGALIIHEKFFSIDDVALPLNTLSSGVKIITARIGHHLFVDKFIVR